MSSIESKQPSDDHCTVLLSLVSSSMHETKHRKNCKCCPVSLLGSVVKTLIVSGNEPTKGPGHLLSCSGHWTAKTEQYPHEVTSFQRTSVEKFIDFHKWRLSVIVLPITTHLEKWWQKTLGTWNDFSSVTLVKEYKNLHKVCNFLQGQIFKKAPVTDQGINLDYIFERPIEQIRF